MSKYFMGVDAGTHGVRVGITDDQGQFIAMHEVEHPTEYPVSDVQNRMLSIVGWFERSIKRLFK